MCLKYARIQVFNDSRIHIYLVFIDSVLVREKMVSEIRIRAYLGSVKVLSLEMVLSKILIVC